MIGTVRLMDTVMVIGTVRVTHAVRLMGTVSGTHREIDGHCEGDTP
ncbi:hypothetical protein E2C01_071184 [Portunus trituberculatus]|uniref:Uncharacterized protein n=1 Tax=Portunus trituberculatus TaxID=210409 RepID=A0A5B7I3R1_PORTR|nr:hypothetical protein [Portunus trituberculatus]